MSITIERDIPAPAPRTSGARAKYPFDELEVGESFLFPKGTTTSAAASGAHYARRNLRRQFTLRATPDGIRCWRTA